MNPDLLPPPPEIEVIVKLKYYPIELTEAWLKSLPVQIIDQLDKDYSTIDGETDDIEIDYNTKIWFLLIHLKHKKESRALQFLIVNDLIAYEYEQRNRI